MDRLEQKGCFSDRESNIMEKEKDLKENMLFSKWILREIVGTRQSF